MHKHRTIKAWEAGKFSGTKMMQKCL